MKPYTVSVDIDLPRDKVIELFDSTDNLWKWQPGLQSFDHISGEPGQEGAISRAVFIQGRHVIELTGTITKRDLPDEIHGTYVWDGGSNTLVDRFTELGPERTRWESTCAYELKHLMIKVMGFLMPGMFKKQNQEWLDHFKAFAETGADVRETPGQ